MQTSEHEPRGDVAAALRRVGEIDFSHINKKLQYDDPDFWTDERVAEAEDEIVPVSRAESALPVGNACRQ